MKLFLFTSTLLSLVGNSFAGVSPKLSLTVKDGNFGDVKSALAPKLSVGGEVGPGIEVGADVDVGLDILGSKKSIWGSKSASVAGWNLKARAEYSEGKYDYGDSSRGVYLSLEANDDDESLYGWVSGDVCKSGVQPLKIGAKKVFDTSKGKFMIQPRCRFYAGTTDEGPDVCLGYQPSEDTSVYLTASKSDQNVKIVQNINEDNTASVKFGRASAFEYAKIESNSELGKSTVTVTTKDVDLELQQGGWAAGMSLAYPLQNAEPQVRFSKKFSVVQA